MVPSWNPLLLSSGAYKYAPALRGPDLETALTAGELPYYREGSTGTVAVRRLAGTTSLSIDGKVDASDAADMLTQRMLAHVPLLLHPAPKKAAILGLGSGVTLGSALTHGLERAVVLEISPEVVEASRFFEAANHRALQNPATRLVVGDGRTHLLLGDEQYDVIVSEPSNPWMAGIASLFTQEFFQVAKSRLAPGGVLCQWAHTYDISDADLRSIVATFLSVFPNGTLWLVGEADVLLIGSTEPLTDRIAGIEAAWRRPGVAEDLASVGATAPLSVLSAVHLGRPGVEDVDRRGADSDRQPGASGVLGAPKHLRLGSRRQRQFAAATGRGQPAASGRRPRHGRRHRGRLGRELARCSSSPTATPRPTPISSGPSS